LARVFALGSAVVRLPKETGPMKSRNRVWIVAPALLLVTWLPGGALAQEDAERPREEAAAEAPRGESDRDAVVRLLQERLERLEKEIADLRETRDRDAARDREGRGPLGALREAREARREEGRDAGAPPPEARKRLENLTREIRELREAGQSEEAGRLEQEVRAIIERFRGALPQLPPEVGQKLETLKSEIAKLREAGENDKAAELERAAREIIAQFSRGSSEEMRRIHHLRIAAENLRAGGMPDLAEQVTHQIERLEREAAPPDDARRDSPDRERDDATDAPKREDEPKGEGR
jgi:hypothetical protein